MQKRSGEYQIPWTSHAVKGQDLNPCNNCSNTVGIEYNSDVHALMLITEIIFKGNTKHFRDGAFRMKPCLYILNVDLLGLSTS